MHVNLWEITYLSIKVAIGAVALGAGPGIYCAWWLSRTKSIKRKFLIENLIQLPLVIPPVVTGYLLLLALSSNSAIGQLMLKMGWTIPFTPFAAVLAAGVVAFPFLVQTARISFDQIEVEAEEVVFVFGGTRWDAFRFVILPLAGRGVIGGLVLGFARAIGEFGATIMLAGNIPGKTQTLPLAVFSAINTPAGGESAFYFVLSAIGISILSLIAYRILISRRSWLY